MTAAVVDMISAVYTAAVNSGSLTGVTIVNGPRVSSETDIERLFIGVDIDPAVGLSAEGNNSPDSLPGVIDQQTFNIVCVAETWAGSPTDLDTRRARVFAIRDVVKALIRPDGAGKVLNVSGVQSAYLGSWQLYQSQTSKGPYAGLQFRIECIERPSTS
jgi:hypothetical protein